MASTTQTVREWRRANPEKYREQRRAWNRSESGQASIHKQHLKKTYGMTPEEYGGLLDKQDGKCAICESTPGKRKLCVDHCHVSGKIRGLLCINCNSAIGMLGEDPEVFAAAVSYLEGC